MDKNGAYDKFITENGQEINVNDYQITQTQTLVDNLDKQYNDLVYANDELLPQQEIIMPTAEQISYDKDSANEHMIQQLALNKLKKERDEYNKLSDEQKIKDYIFKMEYYKNTNDFFYKHGYEMSGSQKRNLKRIIERAWKKGKYKLSEQEKDDILYEISMQAEKQAQSTGKPITNYGDLKSLVF